MKGRENVGTFLICIDAGHGINTAGKRCMKTLDPAETREWTLNNRIANHLQNALKSYDCQTMRVDDVTGKNDVSLQNRVDNANAANANVYISIHHNAGINGGSGGGICVFVNETASAKSVELQTAVYESTVDKTGLRGNRANPKPKATFYVLRKTAMPAILGEFGFMDSSTDVPIILTDGYAKSCADGIAEAIADVFGLKRADGTPVRKWYADAQKWAIDAGITDGTNPDKTATRAEVWAMLYRMNGGK